MATRRPEEFFKAGRPGKVIVAEAYPAAPSKEKCLDGRYTPLEEISLSRIKLTIINASGPNARTPYCNIPTRDIPAIRNKAQAASVVAMMRSAGVNSAAETTTTSASAPYTAKFAFGQLAGKTIPQVLGDNPQANLATLQRQRSFLQENLTRFPKNQAIIDEITRAEKEIQDGTYNQTASAAVPAAANVIPIYKKENKPLTSRPGENGTVLVYGVEIHYDLTKDSPWVVTIQNCYAPLEAKGPAGQSVPAMSQAINKIAETFVLTDEEFQLMLELMHSIWSNHRATSYQTQAALVSEIGAAMRSSS